MATVAATADSTAQLEALYRVDGDRLWRVLLAVTGDHEMASDAVAEAFAQALRRGQALTNPRAWVWRAGFRIAAGELKRRRTTTPTIPDIGYFDAAVDTELIDAIAQLPIKQRAVVVLFYYADAPVRHIADRTGMSQLSVRANLSRGRKRLKQILGDRDD
jgi:RNA polymerase sigma-70 factor, ECF subfamily